MALDHLKAEVKKGNLFKRSFTTVFNNVGKENTESLWKVVCHKGVTVRESFDPCSPWVAFLPSGTVTHVTKVKENRVRICKPVDGWIVFQMLDEEHSRLQKMSGEEQAEIDDFPRLRSAPLCASPPPKDIGSDSSPPCSPSMSQAENFQKCQSADLTEDIRNTLVPERKFTAPMFKFSQLDNGPRFCDSEVDSINSLEDLVMDMPDLESDADPQSDFLLSTASQNPRGSLWERRKKKGMGSLDTEMNVEHKTGNLKDAKSFAFDKSRGIFTLRDENLSTTPATKYGIVHCVYQGANSSVFKVEDHNSDECMALKSIDVHDKSARRMLYSEIKILRSLDHPNIIGLYDAAYDPKQSTVSLLLEWMEGGCLSDVVKTVGAVKTREIRKIAKDILQGLDYIHKMSIIHRDIKPSNIVLNEKKEAKLADFGIAINTKEQDIFGSQEIGTLNYMAPERLNAEPYDASSDIWSFGVLIYYLCEGRTKYSGYAELTHLINQICFQKDLPSLSSKFPKSLITFLNNCCAFEKEKRLSAEELLKTKFLKKTSTCRVS